MLKKTALFSHDGFPYEDEDDGYQDDDNVASILVSGCWVSVGKFCQQVSSDLGKWLE